MYSPRTPYAYSTVPKRVKALVRLEHIPYFILETFKRTRIPKFKYRYEIQCRWKSKKQKENNKNAKLEIYV